MIEGNLNVKDLYSQIFMRDKTHCVSNNIT
ncbi:hypothetical protein KQS06HV_300027 [Klebsiella quasipneumoniae subsp. similipneumoniae]|nr:hypothetical protein KQS06HV_300027 [Klebsiella quasipneumoniae subsp. similipneumoniae]